MSDIEVLCDVPGVGDKMAEKMQRSAAKVVAEEEEELRNEAATRKAQAEASELGLDGERALFMQVRGIGERTIDQLAEGGYFTLMQIQQEENIVKLGEVTGIGIKKARQIKQAVNQYLEEQARLALMPQETKPAEVPDEAGQIPSDQDTPSEPSPEPESGQEG